MVNDTIKQKILGALNQKPEGMTIQDLSRELKVTRITITKYVQGLLGAEEVLERRVGVYRFLSLNKEKK